MERFSKWLRYIKNTLFPTDVLVCFIYYLNFGTLFLWGQHAHLSRFECYTGFKSGFSIGVDIYACGNVKHHMNFQHTHILHCTTCTFVCADWFFRHIWMHLILFLGEWYKNGYVITSWQILVHIWYSWSKGIVCGYVYIILINIWTWYSVGHKAVSHAFTPRMIYWTRLLTLGTSLWIVKCWSH